MKFSIYISEVNFGDVNSELFKLNRSYLLFTMKVIVDIFYNSRDY